MWHKSGYVKMKNVHDRKIQYIDKIKITFREQVNQDNNEIIMNILE